MEVKINREIRNYTESMFFGLSLRQFVFSLLAVGVAVLLLSKNDIQDDLIIRNGCGGTRAAYGTTVLLRTTSALLDSICKVLDGSIAENILINITPDNLYVSSGLIPMEGCTCCGD